MIEFAHAVATAVAPAASVNSTTLFATLAACAVGAAALAITRLRAEQQQLSELKQALQAAKQAATATQEQHRKQQADSEARRDELKTLKQDIGAQRKKNHTAQEEIRKLREAVREQTRLRVEAQNSRPAFADVPEPKAPEPKIVVAPPPPPPPVVEPPKVDAEMAAKVKRLEGQVHDMQAKFVEERQVTQGFKEELKKMRKRSEDLRRIDIITKSKMELLEDKLRNLGRQYYEAISELAALKGEVVPPRPRDLPPEREPPTDDNESDDESLAEAPAHPEAAPGGEMASAQ